MLAWDPTQANHITKIEMVQRRAARFIKREYSRQPGTVTNILKDLSLPTLETRRKIQRLCILHKSIHGHIAVKIPSVYMPRQNTTTRNYHPLKYININTATNTYKFSFFPRTIKEWNDLPYYLLEIKDPKSFKKELSTFINGK